MPYDLTGESGITRVIPLNEFRRYAFKKIDCITGFIGKKEAHWEAHSTKHIYIVKYFSHTIAIGKGETEIEANNDAAIIGGYKYNSYNVDTVWPTKLLSFFSRAPEPATQIMPSTSQIIDFLKWKVPEDQILEFSEN